MHVPSGTYRNRHGDEIEVIGPWVPNGFATRHGTLGGIYEAMAVSGRHRRSSYLVTQAALEATGYELLSNESTADG